MNIFERRESEVRSYCRKYPVVFSTAKNAEIFSEKGERYIDFLAVAGSMNYGHNNPVIKEAIINYLSEDNIINALDMHTIAKSDFLNCFEKEILEPRDLDYKIMCCGPTGTNAVEAALKLARKNKGRQNIFAFSGAFHGMSLGSLALTTDATSRQGAGVALDNVTFIPYENDLFDSLAYIKNLLDDDHSGIDKPAAIILETIQAEGGINVASVQWLKEIRQICNNYDILLICDDIQVGIGRSGYFFSFERAGIKPDMVVLSKSISGFGLPMSLLLMKPELDIFRPAEHNGTFRGNQLGFVGATMGIKYFVDNELGKVARQKGEIIEKFIVDEILPMHNQLAYRGVGMIWGIDFSGIDTTLALQVVRKAFNNFLVMEVAGRRDAVLKIMPPITIEDDILIEGLNIVKKSMKEVLLEHSLMVND